MAISINRSIFYIKVSSNSMYPTIREDDKLLALNKYKNIERNDIIIFYSEELSRILIKRVVGVPGDSIYVDKDNNFVINDEIVIKGSDKYNEDSYIYKKANVNNKITIEEGHYFVVGDNLENSFDSRLWEDTFISKKDILGKALALVNPLDRFEIFY